MSRLIALAGDHYEIVTAGWTSIDEESRCLDAVQAYLVRLEATDSLRLHEALLDLSNGALDFELERIVMTSLLGSGAFDATLELRPRALQHV